MSDVTLSASQTQSTRQFIASAMWLAYTVDATLSTFDILEASDRNMDQSIIRDTLNQAVRQAASKVMEAQSELQESCELFDVGDSEIPRAGDA